MTHAYAAKLSSVRTELTRYTHSSVLRRSLEYLAVRHDDPIDELRRMPWVVMFLLKQCMLGQQGPLEASGKDFNRLAQAVFDLQGEAADLETGNIELKIRAMLLNQSMYQKQTVSCLRNLLIQRAMFARADNYYDLLFENQFGITITNYTLITFYIIVRLEKQNIKNVVKMPITEIIHYLCPTIPPRHILAYIRLAACHAEHLPGFIEQHDLKGIYASEYFQETPFKYIPFILEDQGLIVFNYKFCIAALSQLAPSIFKKESPNFKDQFGLDMERKAGEFLKGLQCDQLLTEGEIDEKLRLAGVRGKKVDFLVREGNNITLIECKAIEPTDMQKCSVEPEPLRHSLRPSFLYAIEQGQFVASALSKSSEFADCTFRQLIVTYEDFYIFGGKFISENIEPTMEDSIRSTYGVIPVPLDRVSYIPFQEFAVLIKGLAATGESISKFLDTACDDQAKAETRRFTLSQVVEEKVKVPGIWAAAFRDEINQKDEALVSMIGSNLEHWQRHPEKFMDTCNAVLAGLNPTGEGPS